LARGVNINNLKQDHFREIPIPVAPLAEQKRIADKLDTVLARVDACRDRLSRVAPLLKRFRQSVLNAAVAGRLHGPNNSAKYRPFRLGEETLHLPEHWQRMALRDVIDPKRPLCYGVVQPGAESVEGIPLVRVQDMERGQILRSGLRTISKQIDEEFSRSRIQRGDLLISVVGTIGRTAIVPAGLEANIARAIARISCAPGCSSDWLDCWLNTPAVQWWLSSSSKEVARKTLNLSDLAVLPVPLPPVDEQAEIVRRVEALFAFADRLEARLASAQAAADRLTPALLAKALRGELVPQNPADEPATELLARLRAQRESTPPTRKARRTRRAEEITE
jgi:type I restriction enzyme S subunit